MMPAGNPDAPRTRWSLVATIIGVGIVNVMIMGRVLPALPLLRAELDLGLVTAGWVISLYSLIGALFGILIGTLADRIGHARQMVACLLFVSGGAAIGALAEGAALLLVSRLIEGIGYVGLAVAGPSLIARAVAPADRARAVGSWGITVPTGLTLSLLVAPLALGPFGWRGLWLAAALASLVLFLAILRLPRAAPAGPPADTPRWRDMKITLLRPGPWVLSLIFLFYGLQWMGLMAWLPTFAVEQRGAGVGLASGLTAAVLAVSALGNWWGNRLLQRGISRPALVALGSLAMGLTSVGIFPDILSDGLRYGLCLAFSLLAGIAPPAVLTGVPAHSPSPGQVGGTNGLVFQGGQVGLLLGPPLVAMVVSLSGGWGDVVYLMAACTLVSLFLAACLGRLERG